VWSRKEAYLGHKPLRHHAVFSSTSSSVEKRCKIKIGAIEKMTSLTFNTGQITSYTIKPINRILEEQID
jgi:hypothetical protein